VNFVTSLILINHQQISLCHSTNFKTLRILYFRMKFYWVDIKTQDMNNPKAKSVCSLYNLSISIITRHYRCFKDDLCVLPGSILFDVCYTVSQLHNHRTSGRSFKPLRFVLSRVVYMQSSCQRVPKIVLFSSLGLWTYLISLTPGRVPQLRYQVTCKVLMNCIFCALPVIPA